MADKSAVVSIRLQPAVFCALVDYARRKRMSHSEAARQIIVERLSEAQADPVLIAHRVLFLTCGMEHILAAHPDRKLHENVRRVFEEMTSKGARDAS